MVESPLPGGGVPSETVGDVRQKKLIKPLKETNLDMARDNFTLTGLKNGHESVLCYRVHLLKMPRRLKIMAFLPEYPNINWSPRWTSLSETTSVLIRPFHLKVAVLLASRYTYILITKNFFWNTLTVYVFKEGSKGRNWDKLQKSPRCSLVKIKVKETLTCDQSLFSFHLNISHHEVQ